MICFHLKILVPKKKDILWAIEELKKKIVGNKQLDGALESVPNGTFDFEIFCTTSKEKTVHDICRYVNDLEDKKAN